MDGNQCNIEHNYFHTIKREKQEEKKMFYKLSGTILDAGERHWEFDARPTHYVMAYMTYLGF